MKKLHKGNENIRRRIRSSTSLKICLISSALFSAAFILTLAIVSTLNYRIVSKKEEEGFHSYMVDSLMAVDNKLKDMERVSLMSTTGDEVQDIVKNYGKKTILNKNADEGYLTKYFSSLVTLRQDISGIYLFDQKNMIYSYDTANPSRVKNISEYEVLGSMKALGEGMLTPNCQLVAGELPAYMKYGSIYSRDNYYKNCIWMIRDVYSFSPYEQIGCIALTTPVRTFNKMLDETVGDNIFYILCTPSGKIICSQDGSQIGKNIIEISPSMQEILNHDQTNVIWQNEKCRTAKMQSEYSGLILIVGKAKSVYFQEVTGFLKYSIFYGLLAMVLVIILTFFGVKRILRPMETLSKKMSHFDENSLKDRLLLNQEDEVGQLVTSFNEMLDLIQELIENRYVNEMKIKESKLTEKTLSMLYLKSQVNPHFLYNTIDTIRIQAQINGDKDVADLLIQLVDFFRLSVKVDQQMVTLEHELKLIRAYMSLMCYRYPKIICTFDVDKSLYDVQVPNFILQPIVENSILHGLRDKGYQGELHVQAYVRRDNGYMEIDIEDTGVGFNDMTRKEVESMLNNTGDGQQNIEDRNSIGIINVQERIKMLYGNDCGLWYTENKGEGVTAHILLRVTRDRLE